MNHWTIKSAHPDAPPGFPFAILNWKKEVIAWVKTKKDAEYIKSADLKIYRANDSSSRFKRMWIGK